MTAGLLVATAAVPATIARLHAPTQAPPAIAALEAEGVRAKLGLVSIAGADSIATLSLADAATGEPLRSAAPRAWLTRRAPGTDAPASCRDRVRSFTGGLLSAQAEVDLNQSFLVAMNDDNTLSVINPQLAFDRTKLRSVVTLPGVAKDWALHPDRKTLYVTVPEADRVSVVDLERFLATGSVAVGKRPGQIALSPDSRTIWIGNDEDGTVTVIGHERRAAIATLAVGSGPQHLAFAADGAEVWVASEGSGELRAFDSTSHTLRATIPLAKGALHLAASEKARAVWVARESGEVAIVDFGGAAVRQRLTLPPGVTALRFDPSGRWALALHRGSGDLTVVDASSGEIRSRFGGFHGPEGLGFTDRYAYVHESGRPVQTLVSLEHLARPGDVPVVEVNVGQAPTGSAREGTLASVAAPTPARDGVWVASPADRTIYFYAEGMMAPMGTLKNYGRAPRSVLLVDRSLVEVQPGVYRTSVARPKAGLYDVAVAVPGRKAALCFTTEVEALPSEARENAPAFSVIPTFDTARPLVAGEETRLRFRIEGAQEEPLDELSVLAFRPPGTWQWRGAASAVERGTFEVALRPPTPGRLQVLVGAPGHGAPLGTFPSLDLAVVQASAPSLTTSGVTP